MGPGKLLFQQRPSLPARTNPHFYTCALQPMAGSHVHALPYTLLLATLPHAATKMGPRNVPGHTPYIVLLICNSLQGPLGIVMQSSSLSPKTFHACLPDSLPVPLPLELASRADRCSSPPCRGLPHPCLPSAHTSGIASRAISSRKAPLPVPNLSLRLNKAVSTLPEIMAICLKVLVQKKKSPKTELTHIPLTLTSPA